MGRIYVPKGIFGGLPFKRMEYRLSWLYYNSFVGWHRQTKQKNERKGKTQTFKVNRHYYAVAIQKAYYRKIPGRKAQRKYTDDLQGYPYP